MKCFDIIILVKTLII